MSKKIFSLISEKKIVPASSAKVIPKESFSSLKEAVEILEEVKQEALEYRKETAEEIEKTKEEGFKEGYEEGLEQWAEKLASFEKKLRDIQEDLQKKVVPIALKAAQKIVGREIELSEETIVDIVSSSLKSVAQHKKIVIYVNKKELAVLEKNKSRLKDLFENLESFSIRPREDVSAGGCVIETEIGIINAQIEQRWQILEKAFEKLLT